MRAGANLAGGIARGQLSVFLGDILLADVTLTIPVDSSATPPTANAPTKVEERRAVPQDLRLVLAQGFARRRAVRAVGAGMGDEYLRDWQHLRRRGVGRAAAANDRGGRRFSTLLVAARDGVGLRPSGVGARTIAASAELCPANLLGGAAARRPGGGLPPAELHRLHFQRIGPWSRRTSISVVCPSCHARMKVPDNLLGRAVRCPRCLALFAVGAVTADPPVAAAYQPPPRTVGTRQADGGAPRVAAKAPSRRPDLQESTLFGP